MPLVCENTWSGLLEKKQSGPGPTSGISNSPAEASNPILDNSVSGKLLRPGEKDQLIHRIESKHHDCLKPLCFGVVCHTSSANCNRNYKDCRLWTFSSETRVLRERRNQRSGTSNWDPKWKVSSMWTALRESGLSRNLRLIPSPPPGSQGYKTVAINIWTHLVSQTKAGSKHTSSHTSSDSVSWALVRNVKSQVLPKFQEILRKDSETLGMGAQGPCFIMSCGAFWCRFKFEIALSKALPGKEQGSEGKDRDRAEMGKVENAEPLNFLYLCLVPRGSACPMTNLPVPLQNLSLLAHQTKSHNEISTSFRTHPPTRPSTGIRS